MSPLADSTLRLHGHVLLVEGNVVNQLVARTFLEDLTMRVSVVDNGRMAVNRVVQETFDLVLMDCQMPDMDGFEAASLIRERQRENVLTQRLPIVALTANAVECDRARCLAAGMDDFLSKPFNREQLASVLLRWLPQPDASSIDVRALDALRDLPGGRGPQLVNKVIDAFLADMPVRVGQLRSAAVVGDAAALRMAAHSLKSSSGFVGAQRLVSLCKELEAIDSGDVAERAPTLLLEVDSEVARVIHALTSQRANST